MGDRTVLQAPLQASGLAADEIAALMDRRCELVFLRDVAGVRKQLLQASRACNRHHRSFASSCVAVNVLQAKQSRRAQPARWQLGGPRCRRRTGVGPGDVGVTLPGLKDGLDPAPGLFLLVAAHEQIQASGNRREQQALARRRRGSRRKPGRSRDRGRPAKCLRPARSLAASKCNSRPSSGCNLMTSLFGVFAPGKMLCGVGRNARRCAPRAPPGACRFSGRTARRPNASSPPRAQCDEGFAVAVGRHLRILPGARHRLAIDRGGSTARVRRRATHSPR